VKKGFLEDFTCKLVLRVQIILEKWILQRNRQREQNYRSCLGNDKSSSIKDWFHVNLISLFFQEIFLFLKMFRNESLWVRILISIETAEA
jgi:hypothetical protein